MLAHEVCGQPCQQKPEAVRGGKVHPEQRPQVAAQKYALPRGTRCGRAVPLAALTGVGEICRGSSWMLCRVVPVPPPEKGAPNNPNQTEENEWNAPAEPAYEKRG